MPAANQDKIRVATLPRPFMYRRMEDVEEQRKNKSDLPHRHDYFVVIYVEKARGIHSVDFIRHELTGHAVYFISQEQVHHLDITGTPQGHVLLFTVDFQRLSGGDP